MQIRYVLCNPTGNITALVDSPVPVENQPMAAEQIMKKEPTCEQVGFILEPVEGSDITLRMAGGEFCGNATMSTAAYYCKKALLNDGESKEVKVKVVGTSGLIPVRVKKEKTTFFCTLEMPKPLKISEELFSFENHNYRYPVVSFTGISHVVIEDNVPVYLPEGAIKLWADKLKVSALGLMLLNRDKSEIRPLVYVNYPESLIWESSCASGTTAVGAYLAKKSDTTSSFSFKEPGGVLKIEKTSDGRFLLTGQVDF